MRSIAKILSHAGGSKVNKRGYMDENSSTLTVQEVSTKSLALGYNRMKGLNDHRAYKTR